MQRFLQLCQVAALVACLAWCAFLHFRSPRIAYVRSGVILDTYAGMREARNAYQSKMEGWQGQLDTLRQAWQVSLTHYEQERGGLAAAGRLAREQELQNKQYQFEKQQAVLSEKARLEEEKLLKGTLDQINRYVEKYGREHGYTVVLGTTQSGNLLYASEAVDITEQVIEGLNQSYK
jgi:outer membrane protein